MALKTVYLYPDLARSVTDGYVNPEALAVDDEDLTWAAVDQSAGYHWLQPVFSAGEDIPADLVSVEFHVRVRPGHLVSGGGSFSYNVGQTFIDAPYKSQGDWVTHRLSTSNGPIMRDDLEELIPYFDNNTASDISFVRLAVTYDDGQPEPEPRERAEIAITDTKRTEGDTRPVTVTTEPPGLPVRVRYDGQDEPPTEPGTYAVLATVWTETHWGQAAAVLTVGRAIPEGGIVNPELVITSGSHMTEGDTEPAMRGQILSGGEAQDLTVVKITIAPGPGYPALLSREAIVDGKDWILPWQEGEARPGVYQVQATVDGKQCAPAQGYGLVQIQRRLG